jgi:hypothetical protein
MVTRILLLLLCLGVLSTGTGCYVDPSPYGTSSSGMYGAGVGAYQGDPYAAEHERQREAAERRYWRQRYEQDQAYRQWERRRQRELESRPDWLR